MDLQKRPTQEPPLSAAELRASDADRDRIADLLRDALAEGRLTADEHAERVEGVLAAKTVGELDVFVRDLPAGQARKAGPAYVPPVSSVPNRPTPGAIPIDPDDRVVAVFSASTRKGRWRPGRRIHAYAIFGSVELDLSEALFEHRQVMIKVISVFGSVEIRVPENVSLRGSGAGVLGDFAVDALDSEETDAPVVYVDGLAVLGSVEAKPKRGKVIADLLGRVTDHVARKVDDHLRKRLDR
ncbi:MULTISPECIES: DUF1707 SHOCT-like domain-containing protein [Streptomyces]|uniref:DUF1707 domain-containing protein n=1 Tax=Streptomyces caniscabiei TaxID=2746961 RepID=A0ABU4MK46_9ACTN|nr:MULTISPECIES: DUF1707 domain-containing protein [Streptomyces]MBE4738935.1 DUF1707 and DUF2154 domain-containing protein [Streptomyces caniscabiei]MBE4757925.1 DUF1707 and DUF2154 domain-containing protein [Streptomyces caniscabiei]MBE4772222.1 DUF1707 and DUF2154 domain-containing protein [Streptomyces caniscabiei]MBE4787586.1 DUF1707 and DUF2154 domain-containing protein [Streptomyces caniscabiei]MBE4794301.1 DUF1707 and DUF2154 domain-containing protein [Streptomyces caniscabiei]